MSRVKKYFFAGFFIILPVFVTAYVLYAIFMFIDGIWGKVINFYLRKYFGFGIPGLGFILGIITILAVGFIATNLLGKRLFNFFESLFRKFPMIKLIYDPAKQIVTLASGTSRTLLPSASVTVSEEPRTPSFVPFCWATR